MPHFNSLAEYRAAQDRAWLQRNQARLRAEFWDRKRRDREDGERWLAERGLSE